jgi:hypothetical protein
MRKQAQERVMTYRTLTVQCHCGRQSASIKEVGFTSDHQLVLHWRCPGCKSYVYGLKPLSDCFDVCPEEADVESPISEQTVEEMDARFLQALGVRFPDGVDA